MIEFEAGFNDALGADPGTKHIGLTRTEFLNTYTLHVFKIAVQVQILRV